MESDGMPADGIGWEAMPWDGMGWEAMPCDGIGWDGMPCDGIGWDGIPCDGIGWDGMGRAMHATFPATNSQRSMMSETELASASVEVRISFEYVSCSVVVLVDASSWVIPRMPPMHVRIVCVVESSQLLSHALPKLEATIPRPSAADPPMASALAEPPAARSAAASPASGFALGSGGSCNCLPMALPEAGGSGRLHSNPMNTASAASVTVVAIGAGSSRFRCSIVEAREKESTKQAPVGMSTARERTW